MTKLVLVLAVVVVVILVVVIVAVRNMRAEDPEEFDDRRDGRSRTRGHRDERDLRHSRRQPAERQPARAGNDRDFDEPRGRGYDADLDFDQPAGRGRDDRRRAPAPSAPEQRRRGANGTHGPDETPAPARARQPRGRRSDDSSEWDSSEWDKLSDVDYWAELASDKPLTTTAQPAAPHSTARPAAPRNGAQARPGPDLEPETMAARSPVPGAPRRDPVTGLPVRGPQQPADAGLAAMAAGPSDFAAAPVPLSGVQDRQRPMTGPNGERGTHRQRPPAASAGESGVPDRERPLTPPMSESAQRSLAALTGDRSSYLSAGPASLPLPAIRDVPRDRPRVAPGDDPRTAVRDVPRDRFPVAPDDDPLTSPSFPKVPASDSRSYHNGRSDTPAGGSRTPPPYLAPTQQFPSYDSPAPQYPAAPRPAPRPAAQQSPPQRSGQHSAPPRPAAEQPAPRRPGNGSGDAGRTNPHAYRPDPLASRDPYPPRAPSAPPGAASVPPGPAQVPPAASGNPYGSYVTPDSQQTVASSYDGYPAMPGAGHGQSYPPPTVPNGTGQNGNGYWQHQPAAPGHQPDPGAPSYLDNAAQVPDPRTDGTEADYLNGYGRHGQAGYLPSGYPADQQDPAGYAPVDPYGSDGYGGYPEYGAAGR